MTLERLNFEPPRLRLNITSTLPFKMGRLAEMQRKLLEVRTFISSFFFAVVEPSR